MYNSYWNGMGYQPQYYGMNNGAMPDQLAQMRAQQQQPPQAQPQAAPQQQSNSGLIWVQGEAGAKSFIVSPGSTVMLMDSENSVFYLKSSDASGMPLPLRVFEYAERTSNVPQSPNFGAQAPNGFDPTNYITRKEFEEFMANFAAPSAPEKKASKGDSEK